jgi:type VI secretion system secreted protein VgrG
MPTATDAFRIAKAHTPLGPKLLFREMTGREELSRPFDYRLELLAEDDSTVDPKALLGRGITVELEIQGGGSRYIDTQCVRFAYVGIETVPGRNTKFYRYEARLRPWTHYMTLSSTCRVFQNQAVPDIVRKVLEKYPFPVDFRLSRDYRSWEYCVQYQETDFNFMTRLLEHEGIYYFFEHSSGSHRLVLADHIGAHSTLPNYAKIPHLPSDKMVVPDEEYIDFLQMVQEMEPGEVALRDFDFKRPRANLNALAIDDLPYPWGDREIFEWPGGYWDPKDGTQYASTRLEELQQPKERVTAQSTVRGLTPGYLFTLERCPRRDQNREYLITVVDMTVRNNPYHTGTGRPAEWQFSLIAQPSQQPYRPARLSPKPRTTGPQTALVAGLKNNRDEEIVCDEYGRVRVQFNWDREHDYDEESSCWIRVSSGWAGNNWGQISIPRVGQEVIVDFLNGDPDYPIIIGRVYNEDSKVPYALPKWKEYSTWKSRSTKHGGNNDWNEIRFYDYKGKEQVFIHAQWRMDVRVKWKKYETVKESSHFLMGACFMTAGGEYDIYAGGDFYTQCKGGQYVQQGGDHHSSAGGDSLHLVTAAKEVNARSITLEAAKSVVLKVGGSFVEVSPMGVTIQGPLVRINSGGSASPTGPVKLGDAAHASPADTGEPGYLDRPYRGGGGGSRWHTKDGYHSRPVTYNPSDGSFTYGGSGIVVKGTPDFADKTLQTLGGLDSTPTGKKLIDNLQDNGKKGKVVTIEEATQAEADDSGGGSATRTGSNPNNAFPAGVNGSDGSGTNTTIKYKPGYGANSPYTDNSTTPPTTYVDSDDETLLGHELIHADHNGKGQNLRNTPDPKDSTGNQEESQTIGINDHANDEVTENNLLKDLNKPFRRTDHDSNAKGVSN